MILKKRVLLILSILTLNLFANEVDRAIELFKAKEYEGAKKILLNEARKLDSNATYILGYMFYYGEGEFISPKVGVEFFEFANKISYKKGVIDIECNWKIVMTEPTRCREFIKREVLKLN